MGNISNQARGIAIDASENVYVRGDFSNITREEIYQIVSQLSCNKAWYSSKMRTSKNLLER